MFIIALYQNGATHCSVVKLKNPTLKVMVYEDNLIEVYGLYPIMYNWNYMPINQLSRQLTAIKCARNFIANDQKKPFMFLFNSKDLIIWVDRYSQKNRKDVFGMRDTTLRDALYKKEDEQKAIDKALHEKK